MHAVSLNPKQVTINIKEEKVLKLFLYKMKSTSTLLSRAAILNSSFFDYSMLGIIKRNFAYISRNCFVILYKSLARSHLEYASVWYPKRKTDIDKLERV